MELKKYIWQWLGLLLIIGAYIFGLGPHFWISFILLGGAGLIDAGLLIKDKLTISHKIQRQFRWQRDLGILVGILVFTAFWFWGKDVKGEQVFLFSLLFAICGHFFWHGD